MRSTCLGCGCTCDDIELRVEADRIVEARHACPLGVAWFRDGTVPARMRVGGGDASLERALDAAVSALAGAARPLIYLAADLSCEAQREGIALADWLRASLASLTSSTVVSSLLAAQEQGRASATLGEIRNRADVVVFWGVDPSSRYPRYWTRYAPEPVGVHVPEGRRSRRVIAVDVGDSRGPADADLRMSVTADKEVATLTRLTASVSGSTSSMMSGATEGLDPTVVDAIRTGRYVAIVADAEPADDGNGRDAGRASALIAFAQALNATTRGALSTLRAGGNRSGADACTTSQTGYPAAVDFARGYPRYRPHDGIGEGEAGPDVVLLLGDAGAVPSATLRAMRGARHLVIGPHASEGPLREAEVAIDTGVAGIHETGTAVRMDDVPVPLSSPVAGPVAAVSVIRELGDRVRLRVTG
jgi:formylmethanofuran dehydrogenase subunit B